MAFYQTFDKVKSGGKCFKTSQYSRPVLACYGYFHVEMAQGQAVSLRIARHVFDVAQIYNITSVAPENGGVAANLVFKAFMDPRNSCFCTCPFLSHTKLE